MKKGFSIFEMAIALVAIGIIIAMILEGASLVESSKIKAEIQKITKFQSAFATFYTKHDRLPGSVAVDGAPAYSPQAIYKELMTTGIVQDNDFTNTYVKAFWSFQGCEDTWLTGGSAGGSSLVPGIGLYWKQTPLSATDKICLMGTFINPRVDTRTSFDANGSNEFAISPRFSCFIETILDDGIYYAGKGMLSTTAADTHTKLNPRCDDYSDKAQRSGSTYLFRIF